MLISTYDPDAQANCPKCGLVSCLVTGGFLIGGNRYMDFFHEDCETKWRYWIDKGENTPIIRDED